MPSAEDTRQISGGGGLRDDQKQKAGAHDQPGPAEPATVGMGVTRAHGSEPTCLIGASVGTRVLMEIPDEYPEEERGSQLNTDEAAGHRVGHIEHGHEQQREAADHDEGGQEDDGCTPVQDPAPPVGAVDDGDGGEQADDDEGRADAEKMIVKLGRDGAMQDDGAGSRKGAPSNEGRGDSADNTAHTVLLSIETSGRGIGEDQRGR